MNTNCASAYAMFNDKKMKSFQLIVAAAFIFYLVETGESQCDGEFLGSNTE